MNSPDTSNHLPETVFAGGSEMAALMRSRDWSQSPLGPVDTWPQSLKTGIRIILGSRYPMFIWWGASLIHFYNDAYISVLGKRHPQALGKSAREIWSELWHSVGPLADDVLNHGTPSWNEEFLEIMERNGYREETYFTFSYSPIGTDDGRIGGIFCACTEDTRRVIDERRLRTLRELRAETAHTKTVTEACQMAAAVFGNNPKDIPFALIYLLDRDRQHARLASTTQLAMGTPASPLQIILGDSASEGWLLDRVVTSKESCIIEDLIERWGFLPGGAWDESPHRAIALPLFRPGQEILGVLIAGISPYRTLDDDYQGFFDLIAAQVTLAIANALTYEEERQQTDTLAALNQAKTTFFNNISHEFRTPLTLMLGPVADALADLDLPLPLYQQQRLELVQRNGWRLLKLANALLDFSRLESDRVQAVYEPTDLATFTTELASIFRSAIERADLRLTVNCPPLPEPVYVDREMWEKIVLNLLSNAFKFTFEGEITVTLRWLATPNPTIELAIQDTGIGIAKAELPHLFERFHRVKGAKGRSFEGSGIGLSLVQELAKLHGGTVRVTSTEGEGSCFIVSMPAGCAHLPPEQIGTTCPLTSTVLGAAPYIEEALQWLGETLPVSIPSSSSSYRILLVDDNADMRDYLQRLLSQRWQVETAPDGAIALNCIQQALPDLVLTDVMMPGIDGFQLLNILRADPLTQGIPVILLSARAGEEATIEGLVAGANDYLIKPFSARELIARVETQLQMSRLRQERSANRFKDEFLLTLTHELQAPLANILAWVRLLQTQTFDASKTARALATIERNAAIEANLVKDLLDVSSILSGQYKLQPQPVDLVQLTQEVINPWRHPARNKRIQLVETLGTANQPIRVLGDRDRLMQAIAHLLSNAIKFTPKGGRVEIELEVCASEVELRVRDTGIGIHPEFLPYVFERFTQAEVPSRHSPGGVGIGLAIAHLLVELHHGTIEVASEGEGLGSIFTVRLPFNEAI
ncbi:response regulator [Desertifilum sp. FACHB-1129]|uniref:histidine kinase n=1 Tax=Desertifilum tharense IPPAS B-1220 TaxID=1781255 RepID=A0A1E5QKN7_9CYAN|nr:MULTISPECIES: ATP-binding protein [Desertifilum]MDA0210240.1 ATP-binding protein [Cyanobacteria bacterium FC1]MBD2310186.1 response regulator [Desertifilum sp. FACHB-1129]MBD2322562.1 response regulator [Desertifilum sp. FACHB-866]MBD2334615.1 response regulator [Desertifilum sp. FACHB-868]OEJ75245.1 histidine kinase [Desertifilum tharense IPPAS B-1220]